MQKSPIRNLFRIWINCILEGISIMIFTANTLIKVFKKERALSDIYFLHSLKEIIADKKRQGVSRKTIEKYTLLSNRLQSFILLKYKKTDLSVN